MEVIGRLAGGIAHDFNNLLTGILLYCDLLSAGLEPCRPESADPKDPPRDGNRNSEKSGLENGDFKNLVSNFDRQGLGSAEHEWTKHQLISRVLSQHVDEVRMAGEQGAALTQQLLAIARKQAAEPCPLRINEIIASTENLLRRLLGEQVELVVALDPALHHSAGLVLADAPQLRQVLLNLVLNARDAMPQGGKIRLTTRLTEFPSAELPGESPESVSRNPACIAESGASRPAVSLMVTDDGCGMNAEIRARLFEPFFTTKNPGKGTGLGLATVQRIVSETGGRIRVESEEGHGTRIEVLLPVVAPSTAQTRPLQPDFSQVFRSPEGAP